LACRLLVPVPPLAPVGLLVVSMIASIAGQLDGGALTNRRPFRAPHHSASMAAVVGGGRRATPGGGAPAPRRGGAPPPPGGVCFSGGVSGVPPALVHPSPPAARERRGRDRPRQ